MWKSSLKLFRNEHFKGLLCNKALITIDLKRLKLTQIFTWSHFKVNNYQLQPTLKRDEYEGITLITPRDKHVSQSFAQIFFT